MSPASSSSPTGSSSGRTTRRRHQEISARIESVRGSHPSPVVTPVDAWDRSSDKLRVLLVVSSPIDEPERLNTGREVEEIHRSLNWARVSTALISLNPPTWRALRATLHARQFDVVHFIGHAKKDRIQLEREAGTADWISAEELAALFKGTGVKLVVLNNCSSEPLGDALVVADVPTIIATSKPLRADAATLVSATLYSAIANGETPRTVVDLIRTVVSRETRQGGEALVTVLGPGADARLLPAGLAAGEAEFFACNPPNTLPPQPRDSFLDRVDDLLTIYRYLDNPSTPFIGVTGLAGTGKSTVAIGAARRYGWRFPRGVAYAALRTMGPFSLTGLLDRLGWGLDGLPAAKQRDVALYELSRGPFLLVLDDLEIASTEDVREIIGLLSSWDTSLGGRALLIMRTRRVEFESLIQANWLSVGNFPEAAAHELLVDQLGGRDIAQAQFGPDLIRFPALCHHHPKLITLTAAALRNGVPSREVANQIEQVEGGPIAHMMEVLDLTISQLQSEVPIAEHFLDCWPVFAGAAAEEAWRFVVAGEDLDSSNPMRHLHNDALEMLQRANIVQRQAFHGAQQCQMHPLITDYLGARWRRLSDSKRREYEERHMQFYSNALTAPDAEYPLILEWTNLVHALSKAKDRQDWRGQARLSRLLVGDRRAVLMKRQLWRQAKQVLPFGLEASRQIGDESLLAHLLYSLGVAQYRTAEYVEARVAFSEAHGLAQKIGDVELVGDTGLQIGRVAYRLVDYEAARTFFADVQRDSAIRRDERRLANALHELGRLSYREGDINGARELLDEALNIRESIEDFEGMAQTLHEIARVLHRLGLESQREDILLQAEAQYAKSLALRKEVGDVVGQQATINQLGLLAFDRSDYDRARAYYDECTALSEALNDRFWIAHNLFRSAGLSWHLNERDEAMRNAQAALELATVLGIRLKVDIELWLRSVGSN